MRKGILHFQVEDPIRAELFSIERLEQHAESLAAAQGLTPKPSRGRSLRPRLYDNAKVLTKAYGTLAQSTKQDRPITPAAEWLLDNFHVVEEQIRKILDDLPPDYYRRLPKLADGPFALHPRIFGVAWALVAHTDSGLDLTRIVRFVQAYQRVEPLTIGELWALPITLRVVLVENLRRIATAIVARDEIGRTADELADRVLGIGREVPESANTVFPDYEAFAGRPAFVAQLDQRLRDSDARVAPVLHWLEERAAVQHLTIEQIVREEHQNQAALNVTVRNIITSMRFINALDWTEFFEIVSLVDDIFRSNSDFEDMDFSTRDLYRRAVEDLSRGSRLSETAVARHVIAAAKRAERDPALPKRQADPGYYLISRGRPAFEKSLSYRPLSSQWLKRINTYISVRVYIGIIALVTLSLLGLALLAMDAAGASGTALLILAVLGLLPMSDLALAFVNRLVTSRFGAERLPGMELADGVPQNLRTLIVVPTLLTSAEAIEQQISNLEIHHLASQDGEFYFALLSDWTDAPSESMPRDDSLLQVAIEGIATLNQRYGQRAGQDRFILLHRHRVWNAGQAKWMGWERKRGKLDELNRLLRGATDTSFMPLKGTPPAVPPDVRYVITLDADTKLPRGAAKRLVGKMAHPLNRPRFDKKKCLVVEGHAILQPRVTPSLPLGRSGSLFQRVFSGPTGLDPYAFAVSDVYQDLFDEGSYVGKGIYDVDAFANAIDKRIPDNTVLSHDLLEGTFARAALASDVEVVEEFPSRYQVEVARQHRWVRGDWQLLPWIFGTGRGAHRCSLPLLGRWKMFDNLRRSLVAPAFLLALIYGWTLNTEAALGWTFFVLCTLALPPLLPMFAALWPRRKTISRRAHLRGLVRDLCLSLLQMGFQFTFLAHHAYLAVDAVLRTLFRLVFNRRLLEWVTMNQTLSASGRQLVGPFIGSVLFTAALGALLWRQAPGNIGLAAPFMAFWLFSPLVASWASRPPHAAGHVAIGYKDRVALRLVARRTWRFFETFVRAEDNFLPPDNFQETPKPVVARRTSPTNIGLYLLGLKSARDFGWIAPPTMIARLEATLATMRKLERYRGHFYNWYTTEDLRSLEPRYVSTVDSGNLVGHLMAVGNDCRALLDEPLLFPLAGLRDSLDLARTALASGKSWRTKSEARKSLESLIQDSEGLFEEEPKDIWHRLSLLARLTPFAEKLVAVADTLVGESSDVADSEVRSWVNLFAEGVEHSRTDWETLLPLSRHEDWLRRQPEFAGAIQPSLRQLAEICDSLGQAERENTSTEILTALEQTRDAIRAFAEQAKAVADSAHGFARETDFTFLFDSSRQLFSIGYRMNDHALDSNYYDLLASEARLSSFLAIAKGDVPARHWFRLGRTLTPVLGDSALASWSGSMFEYLMPSLVMRAPDGSLLAHTARLSVRAQIAYGAENNVPWGISESQFNARDLEMTYQYSGFGVPDLGYKRGLAENLVIAPYATGLAAMVDPQAAVRNFERIAQEGGLGVYGFYEALDYTPSRVPEGARVAVVKAYMAHHQAMLITGIANALFEGAARAAFHAEPIVQSTELLLQERMPRDVPIARPPAEHALATVAIHNLYPEMARRFTSPHGRVPRTHLLSNGRYSVMMTNAGSGYSRWKGMAITRWREDVTRDHWGSYIYLRDIRSGEVWSAGFQPTGREADDYQITFSEERVELSRRDGALATTLEVSVSPEDDAEVRRVTISNMGSRTREIELTSFAEIVLAAPSDDDAHQVFSKMFVETEFLPDLGALMAHRRPRKLDDKPVWAAHLSVVEGEVLGDVQFETNRARFIGRGQTIRKPVAIADGWPMSNNVGLVLDPVFSLRRRVRIPRGATVRVSFWTMAASSREELLELADRHHDASAYDRATTLAWTQAQVQLHHLGISADDAHLFQRLANRILYSEISLRPVEDVLKRGGGPASGLWGQGISGDLPIVVARIEERDELSLARQLLRAHEYLRLKGLAFDLVILNERVQSYSQELHDALDALVRGHAMRLHPGDTAVRGNIFVMRANLLANETRDLLLTAARAVLVGRQGSLGEQLRRVPETRPALVPPPRKPAQNLPEPIPAQPVLSYFNGLGGFSEDGKEYVTILTDGQTTPAPWINVIANADFGFQVSAEGAGFTWSLNSQQNQITQWSNDPVCDSPSEILYIADEETGEIWTPTAQPIRVPNARYIARHGQGYSRFEHSSNGLALDLLQFVPVPAAGAKPDPIKILRLKITNRSPRQRQLSATAYVEWCLGAQRQKAAPFIVTEQDPETLALYARNPWNNDFGHRVAFADLGGKQTSVTASRTEFLGRNGTLAAPAALVVPGLSNKVGPGLDPCAALQTSIRLAPGASTEIVFFLGQTAGKAEADALIAKYRALDLDTVFAGVTGFWDNFLGQIQVKTPDRSFDLMVNRALLYQTLACRIWARAGFYQASGAYGFRDQLQDVMSLCVQRPDLARAQILRAASRQFKEGDVQHWWLPENGRGIRTRISDDTVWLAYVTTHYVEVTGDKTILDENIPFLEGQLLNEDEHEAFFEPRTSEESASLFEHCARALDKSLAVGAHGLPLIGTGDWNDGMNRVGEKGKGESVWLAWFLHTTLQRFTPLAEWRDAKERAAGWLMHTVMLKDAIEDGAWDGDWYRRGYFDDGSPLGSASNAECRIDSIAQSWSVISGAGDPARARRAMSAVEKYLVRRDEALVLLFEPPFDRAQPDPGYIRSYPPGVRENGGQYTHAALWTVMAYALLGEGAKAGELFAMINPINHSANRAGMQRYKVEPYAVAADVYSQPPHVGRGGWTWYTGSAGWMYRVAVEFILGLRVRGNSFSLDPCIPPAWPGFEIQFRHGRAVYEIKVENPRSVSKGIASLELDGRKLAVTDSIPITDEDAIHKIRLVLGQAEELSPVTPAYTRFAARN